MVCRAFAHAIFVAAILSLKSSSNAFMSSSTRRVIRHKQRPSVVDHASRGEALAPALRRGAASWPTGAHVRALSTSFHISSQTDQNDSAESSKQSTNRARPSNWPIALLWTKNTHPGCLVREERIYSCSRRAAREASMMSSRATLSVLVELAAPTCAACFVFATRLHLAERQLIIEVRVLRCSHDALVPSL